MRSVLNVLVGIAIAATTQFASAQDASQKVPGDIVRYTGGALQIKTASGAERSASVNDRTRISVRGASDISQVQPGSFVGVTAAPGKDGTLTASEIHIFPENMRGRGEGHRPMTGADTMTNATVAGISGQRAQQGSMTNATVANTAEANGDVKLKLTYKGGEQVIAVPHGTPVMTTDVGDASLLSPGAHVIVYGTTLPDGQLVADRISVGKDGYVPPI